MIYIIGMENTMCRSFSNRKQPLISISLDMSAEPSIYRHVYQLIVGEVLPKKSAVALIFLENLTDLTYVNNH